MIFLLLRRTFETIFSLFESLIFVGGKSRNFPHKNCSKSSSKNYEEFFLLSFLPQSIKKK